MHPRALLQEGSGRGASAQVVSESGGGGASWAPGREEVASCSGPRSGPRPALGLAVENPQGPFRNRSCPGPLWCMCCGRRGRTGDDPVLPGAREARAGVMVPTLPRPAPHHSLRPCQLLYPAPSGPSLPRAQGGQLGCLEVTSPNSRIRFPRKLGLGRLEGGWPSGKTTPKDKRVQGCRLADAGTARAFPLVRRQEQGLVDFRQG